MRRPTSRLLLRLFLMAALAVLAWWALPWAKNVFRFAALLRDEPALVLPVPVEGVEPGALASTWGAERSGGRRHEGIDIFARRGTRVTSATRGVVTGRGWNRLGGRFVRVLGPGGRHYYYAHLDAFAAADVGDWVEPEVPLGFVGTSGNAAGTPPHLHFGVYDFGGGAVDPFPLLTAMDS